MISSFSDLLRPSQTSEEDAWSEDGQEDALPVITDAESD